MVEWSYGVTTCTQRLNTLLPRTLASLAATGFDEPRLFIDGGGYVGNLPATQRESPIIEANYGNWLLAAWELYLRKPRATYYAIFEDDIILCKGIKQYIENHVWIEKSYLNLFTFATNEVVISNKPLGWCKSDQLGRGALALIFNQDAIISLFSQVDYLTKQHLEPKGYRNVDGTIQTALTRLAGYKEYVHNPSLVQHVGQQTTLPRSIKQPEAKTFPGEDFDILKDLT